LHHQTENNNNFSKILKNKKMKQILKTRTAKVALAFSMFAMATLPVLAEGGKSDGNSGALSAGQVIGGVVVLVAAIIVPIFKSSNRVVAK
jgi:hypothetical protein